MKIMLSNPMIVWLKWLLKRTYLQLKNRKKHLRIGYLSFANECNFGNYNALNDNVKMDHVDLGDFTYLADDCVLNNVRIGKYCSIGHGVKCGLGLHPAKTFVSTHPIFYSTGRQSQIAFVDDDYYEEHKLIEIGNDVWLGANAIVIDGIKIGDGAIVAAGAVVADNVPPYAIVGGVPAKLIRYRFDRDKIDYLLNYRWWDRDFKWLKENNELFRDINLLIRKTSHKYG